jgi:hypothetical protein
VSIHGHLKRVHEHDEASVVGLEPGPDGSSAALISAITDALGYRSVLGLILTTSIRPSVP